MTMKIVINLIPMLYTLQKYSKRCRYLVEISFFRSHGNTIHFCMVQYLADIFLSTTTIICESSYEKGKITISFS